VGSHCNSVGKAIENNKKNMTVSTSNFQKSNHPYVGNVPVAQWQIQIKKEEKAFVHCPAWQNFKI
jgi:hypothetical protein